MVNANSNFSLVPTKLGSTRTELSNNIIAKDSDIEFEISMGIPQAVD